MESKSLFEQACEAQEITRNEWEAVDGELTANPWDKARYRDAVIMRAEAAKRWTKANEKVRELRPTDTNPTPNLEH